VRVPTAAVHHCFHVLYSNPPGFWNGVDACHPLLTGVLLDVTRLSEGTEQPLQLFGSVSGRLETRC
jgi:hypothetical protein